MCNLKQHILFKIITVILIQSFFCLDISWAAGGDIKGLSTHLAPVTTINNQDTLTAFTSCANSKSIKLLSYDNRATQGEKVDNLQDTAQVEMEQLMTFMDKFIYYSLTATWFIANTLLWVWWFHSSHIVHPATFIITSLALLYDVTIAPAFFIFFLGQIKRPKYMSPEEGKRVAMVVLCVPTVEAVDILEETVKGMVNVTYPHDVWVVEDGPVDADITPSIIALCEKYGVKYWTRKKRPEYHQTTWPFQTKTKSGNFNSWLDDVGYDNYDYVVQLDTDHVPKSNYLDKVLGYFRDSKIAYVAAPSIYRNLNNWIARASSETSMVFVGVLQPGWFGWAKTPIIIGSHAAYRVSALREIGGFAQSRAEDHLDTLKFASSGYAGVYIPEVIAEGLGPETFSDYGMQEHQWAMSMMQILLTYYKKLQSGLNWKQKIIFIFTETWYLLYSLSLFTLIILPIIALVTNAPIVSVRFLTFFFFYLPVTLLTSIFFIWAFMKKWTLPHHFLSWRVILAQTARWTFVIVGILNAFKSTYFKGGTFNYIVTPKGKSYEKGEPLPLRSLAAFIILVVISTTTVLAYPLITIDTFPHAQGYIFFAMLSATLSFALITIVLITNIKRLLNAGFAWKSILCSRAKHFLIFTILGILLSVSTAFSGGEIYEVIVNGGPVVNSAVVENMERVSVDSQILHPENGKGVSFGLYNESNNVELQNVVVHEHFVGWDFPTEVFIDDVNNGKIPLITFELWPAEGNSIDYLVDDALNGKYDDLLTNWARQAAAMKQKFLFRPMHEMELSNLYPWYTDDPEKFIGLWRHIYEIFEQNGANEYALWVWSPGGFTEAVNYYPGDDLLDYIGVTILVDEEWESVFSKHNYPRTFREMLNEKYYLAEKFNKPFIISELGVRFNNPEHETQWLIDAIGAISDYPKLRLVVYFNAPTPPNFNIFNNPNWRLEQGQLNALDQALSDSGIIEVKTEVRKHNSATTSMSTAGLSDLLEHYGNRFATSVMRPDLEILESLHEMLSGYLDENPPEINARIKNLFNNIREQEPSDEGIGLGTVAIASEKEMPFPDKGEKNSRRTILVVGGAGYIGSFIVRKLLDEDYNVIVIDDLSTGHVQSIPADNKVVFECVDIKDKAQLDHIFTIHHIDSVIHLAAFANARESVNKPSQYLYNNIIGTANLLQAMGKAGVNRIIFSSSCSVYGQPEDSIVTEETPMMPISPYGESKVIAEKLLYEAEATYGIKHIILRYFNVAGADKEGSIGEDHNPPIRIVSNFVERIRKNKDIFINGNDFSTPDGTALRDYVHVSDIARAHVLADQYLNDSQKSDFFNLGSGQLTSNQEIAEEVIRLINPDYVGNIKYESKKIGDPASVGADIDKARTVLAWEPEESKTSNIIETVAFWVAKNPEGYKDEREQKPRLTEKDSIEMLLQNLSVNKFIPVRIKAEILIRLFCCLTAKRKLEIEALTKDFFKNEIAAIQVFQEKHRAKDRDLLVRAVLLNPEEIIKNMGSVIAATENIYLRNIYISLVQALLHNLGSQASISEINFASGQKISTGWVGKNCSAAALSNNTQSLSTQAVNSLLLVESAI
ncbi:MAG: UDP-glucose 4-epimerase GalE [Candidatus Omnitrophota bacterium]